MFEKEAEEYLKKDGTKAEQILSLMQGKIKVKIKQLPFILAAFQQTYQDGAEFGYNKGFEFGVKSNEKVNQIVANEWHYVKDELPEKEKFILIYTDLKNVYIARLVEDDYFITNKGGFVQTSSVIAWKEIILPKESE